MECILSHFSHSQTNKVLSRHSTSHNPAVASPHNSRLNQPRGENRVAPGPARPQQPRGEGHVAPAALHRPAPHRTVTSDERLIRSSAHAVCQLCSQLEAVFHHKPTKRESRARAPPRNIAVAGVAGLAPCKSAACLAPAISCPDATRCNSTHRRSAPAIGIHCLTHPLIS